MPGRGLCGPVSPSQLRPSQEGIRLLSQRMRSEPQSDQPAGGARATSNLPTQEEPRSGARLKRGRSRTQRWNGGGRGLKTLSWLSPKAVNRFKKKTQKLKINGRESRLHIVVSVAHRTYFHQTNRTVYFKPSLTPSGDLRKTNQRIDKKNSVSLIVYFVFLRQCLAM